MNNEIIDYTRKLLPNIIAAQAQVEGSKLSIAEVREIIYIIETNGIIPKNTKYQDFELVRGLKNGWNFVLNNLDENIDLQFLKMLNTLISDTTNSRPGKIRGKKDIVMVPYIDRNYYPITPNGIEIENQLKETEKIADPVKKSLEYFALISRGQYFLNCNKRTAYLVCNVHMLKSGLGIFYPTNEGKQEFSNYLMKYYLDPNEENKNSMFKYMKENFLYNPILDKARYDQGHQRILEEVVNNSLEYYHLNNS